MANRIILKRNVGVTGPTGGQLVPGEPAIAMDGPTGANSKLYVGIADTITGSVDNVVAVGGGYYTAFVDDIYSKKSIIQGTEQSFTTALRSKITGNEAAIAAITGAYVTGGNISQFSNDSSYLTGFTLTTVANGGSAIDVSIADDTDGNPPSNPRINELTFEAGDGINLFLYKITGDAGGGVPANTAGAKVHIQNDLSSTAFLKSGGTQQQNTNPILHVNGTIDIVGAEVDIGASAFVGFSTTGKVTGNLPVDGDGVFGGIIEASGVSGTGRITGSNIPSTIVTGGNVSQFANDAVYLAASNNLSDVTASTARTNLDLDEIHGKKSLIEGMEQSFTTALKNKLDGIEASADVTDATNVAAANVAGAGFVTGTLDFAINGNDEEISKVKLKDYGETIYYVGTSSSPTFNFENGNVQHCTGSSGIGGGNSITLSNPPPNGVAGTMTVICINCGLIPNSGGFWPSAIKWPGGIEPTLSSSGTDIFSVMTHDGGATYYGFMGGMQFS